MRDITTQTIQALEGLIGGQEPIEWIAATHADHVPHLHTHVIAVVPKRLYKADLEYLRHQATKASLEQRHILDLARSRERERPYPLQRYASPFNRNLYSFQKRSIGSTRGRSSSPRHTTGSCLKPHLRTCICTGCNALHIHSIRDPVHKCKSCGQLLHKQQLRIIKPVWAQAAERQAAWKR
jgi:hypothetical protein